jgi:hypothetical protein
MHCHNLGLTPSAAVHACEDILDTNSDSFVVLNYQVG